MKAFVDTSAFYAFLDADDRRHSDADRIMTDLASRSIEIVSHDHVIGETLALVSARLGRAAVESFIDVVLPVTEVVGISGRRFETAVSVYRLGGFGSVSFVDVASFLLMKEMEIPTAFAFDSDFVTVGFDLLD